MGSTNIDAVRYIADIVLTAYESFYSNEKLAIAHDDILEKLVDSYKDDSDHLQGDKLHSVIDAFRCLIEQNK